MKFIVIFVIIFCYWFPISGQSAENSTIKTLVEIVKPCVFRKDTNHIIFHGCIDWHSSVHGHWGLLWGAKQLNDHTLTNTLLNRFKKTKHVQQEIRLLEKYPDFEMPYGRAWFLMLARDMEIAYQVKTLRPMAEKVFLSLLQFARQEGGYVLAAEYSNASWYLYHLYKWAQYVADKKAQREIRQIIKRRYAQIDWSKYRSNNQEFFDPKALAALLFVAVDIEDQMWINLVDSYKDDSLQPILFPFTRAHQGGLNFSRAWGLWALYTREKQRKYKEAYQAHIAIMMNNIDKWANYYYWYGHWVGQFGLFALRVKEDLPTRFPLNLKQSK